MGKASMFNLDLENVALFATKTKTAKDASSSSDGTYHPAGPSVHKGTSVSSFYSPTGSVIEVKYYQPLSLADSKQISE